MTEGDKGVRDPEVGKGVRHLLIRRLNRQWRQLLLLLWERQWRQPLFLYLGPAAAPAAALSSEGPNVLRRRQLRLIDLLRTADGEGP